MNKQEFLDLLRQELSGLPEEDINERVDFYGEMIEDRMEEGLAEEEAVAEIGSVGDIVSQTVSDIPLTKLVKERIKPKRRMQAWEIVLLVLGFPVWFPLLMSAFAVLFSVYVVIWSVIVSLWAADVSLVAGALGGVIGGIVLILQGNAAQGLLMIAAGAVLAGLAIFLFFGCRLMTRGAVALTKKIAIGIKSLFLRKEDEK